MKFYRIYDRQLGGYISDRLIHEGIESDILPVRSFQLYTTGAVAKIVFPDQIGVGCLYFKPVGDIEKGVVLNYAVIAGIELQ